MKLFYGEFFADSVNVRFNFSSRNVLMHFLWKLAAPLYVKISLTLMQSLCLKGGDYIGLFYFYFMIEKSLYENK